MEADRIIMKGIEAIRINHTMNIDKRATITIIIIAITTTIMIEIEEATTITPPTITTAEEIIITIITIMTDRIKMMAQGGIKSLQIIIIMVAAAIASMII